MLGIMPQTQNPGMMGPPQPQNKWGWDAFKQKGQGLLADPNQLLSNPLFSMGMGLLSENQKPGGGDPFGAAMQGMQSAQGNKEEQEDRKRIEELRARLNELMRNQMAAQLPEIQTGGMGRQKPMPQPPPGPAPQAPFPQMQPSAQQPLTPESIAIRLAAPGITDGERMQLEHLQRQMQQQGGLLGS